MDKATKIAVISTIATGGAGIAALRVHQGYLRAGYQSSFYVLEPGQDSAYLPLALPSSFDTTQLFWTPWLFEHWGNLADQDKMSLGGCPLFSDTLSGIACLSPRAEEIKTADLIHVHWMPGTLFAPGFFDLLRDKKVIWTLHDMNAFTGGCHYHLTCRNFETGCGNCPLLAQPGADDLTRKAVEFKRELYNQLDLRIVTPSQWLADNAAASALLKDFPISVVPNIHDLEIFHPMERKALRQEHGILPADLVILAGMEHFQNKTKNSQGLVKALELLAEARPKTMPTVITFGQGEVSIKGLSHRHLGYITSQEKLADWYAMADLFVHPSLLDNLPNTLCEAQCCGTPVVAFDVGGNREAFLPDSSGFLVAEKSPQALMLAMMQAIKRRGRLKRMRKKAHKFAAERFADQAVIPQYLAVAESQSPPREFRPEVTEKLGTLLCHNQMDSLCLAARKAAQVGMQHANLDQLGGKASQLRERLDHINRGLAEVSHRAAVLFHSQAK
ncbi:MAG: glycosyltransferase [Desulfarculaceae bacterium]|nr:glycosyltransferase [Desulfarculaceae bacterium]